MTARELLDRGTVLRLEGRLSEAIRLLDQAARLSPADADIWLERAIVFDLGGSLDNAAHSYAESARLGGGGLALGGGASVAARKGDFARAREWAVEALRLCPGEPTASVALVRCELASGELADAEARLRALLSADVAANDRMIVAGLLGDVLDRLDRPAEAFVAYRDSKSLMLQLHAPPSGYRSLADTVDEISRVFGSIASVDLPPATDASAQVQPNHVFLIGHPRSGTTLVENILATAQGVEAIEERPTLQDAERSFLNPPVGLAELAASHDAALHSYREAYWQRVRACGVSASATTVVDMDPFKGSRLPIIARLFPAARIVIMRRDPRDVVLSCFRTNFAPGPAALQFATLESAARHYDALTQLQEDCVARLPLAFHELRYEALVSAFDATTQGLCAFLGLEWGEELRRFDRTAERRGVATASLPQVRRGLYDGSGQWRRYEAELQPVMPILAPWVERFGYA